MPIHETVVGFERAQLMRPPERLAHWVARGSLLACALMLLSGCGAAATPAPSAAAAKSTPISIHNFMFSPASLTVPVGTTVSWKNLDGEPHTVTGVDQPFRSGALDENDSFGYKFVKPGTYRYVCSIHPQMVGTIVVK